MIPLAADLRTGFDIARRGLALLPGARVPFPGPRHVQIQTVEGCNGRCPICPAPERRSALRTIDEDLHERILRQLAAAGTVRSVCFMLQNEPLLDPLLPQRVRRARAVLGGGCTLLLVTNGSLLTEGLAGALAASGLDLIQVSLDAVRPGTYREVRPGFDLERAVAGVEAARRRGLRVLVRFVRQAANASEEREFVRFWESRGIEVMVTPLLNRAGALEGYERFLVDGPRGRLERVRRLLGPLLPACGAPLRRLAVLRDGRAILCCQDWQAREVLGDLSSADLPAVWGGARANACRRGLWRRDGRIPALCRACSLLATSGRLVIPARGAAPAQRPDSCAQGTQA